VRSSPEDDTSIPHLQSSMAKGPERNHRKNAPRRTRTTPQQACFPLPRRMQQDKCGPHPRTTPLHRADSPTSQQTRNKTVGKKLCNKTAPRANEPVLLFCKAFTPPTPQDEAPGVSTITPASAQRLSSLDPSTHVS
jgi:hypothetical protein